MHCDNSNNLVAKEAAMEATTTALEGVATATATTTTTAEEAAAAAAAATTTTTIFLPQISDFQHIIILSLTIFMLISSVPFRKVVAGSSIIACSMGGCTPTLRGSASTHP